MRACRFLLTLMLAGPVLGRTAVKIDAASFLPHATTWKLPEYPQKSVNEHHTGVVAATVAVDEHGRVTNVTIVSSPDVHLAEVVKFAVGQWVFRPFFKDGRPLPAESNIAIEFRLQPGGPNVLIPGLTKEPVETIEAPHRHPDQ